jgi:hypothetical protein
MLAGDSDLFSREGVQKRWPPKGQLQQSEDRDEEDAGSFPLFLVFAATHRYPGQREEHLFYMLLV